MKVLASTAVGLERGTTEKAVGHKEQEKQEGFVCCTLIAARRVYAAAKKMI